MILADKIIEERKKNGWSQEEFASQLNVSRQAVSKWESAQSIPDLKRIIEMANLFGVSTDYLLKDEMERAPIQNEEMEYSVYKVTMEQANEFLHIKEKGARMVSRGVSLCILSPVLLIFLSGFEKYESFSVLMGMACLLIFVAIAVYIFIHYGMMKENYNYMETENIETAYGVNGLVKEKKNAFMPTYSKTMGYSVALCILSVIPVIFAGVLETSDFIQTTSVSLLLMINSFSVYEIVKVNMILSSYKVLLQEGDYSLQEKRRNKKLELFETAYWTITTALYLGFSFIINRWSISWIIWPVSGVLYAAVRSIVLMFIKE